MRDAHARAADTAPIGHTVALSGFSAFERSALAACLRLAAQRVPRYVEVESLAQAEFVIADADQQAALALVQAAGRVRDTVFIGHRVPEMALARLTRPIDPLGVLRELDALLGRQRGAEPEITPALAVEAALPAAFDGASAAAQPASAPVPLNSGLMDLGAERSAAPHPERRRRPRQRPHPDDPRRIEMLVVDDSRIAARFLQSRLQGMGHRVEVAAGGAEALDRLARKRYDVVFLDLQLGPPGSLDGLDLCRHIKRGDDEPSRPAAPAVIIVSGSASAADHVRGRLAGCDGFLAKPLLQAQLLQALAPFVPATKAALPRKKVGV